MLVNICMTFHEGILNRFLVTQRTRSYRKIYYFQFQRAITPKIRHPELRLLCSACRLMLLYTCVKFHENISNRFGVTEQTRFCDGQTDRCPGQKQDVSQPNRGRHNDKLSKICEAAGLQLGITADRHTVSQVTYCMSIKIQTCTRIIQ